MHYFNHMLMEIPKWWTNKHFGFGNSPPPHPHPTKRSYSQKIPMDPMGIQMFG
jgi:hypothetical protein